MRQWTACTNRGRVVYDRKTHLFTYRDAVRIAKQLPEPDIFGKYFRRDFNGLLELISIVHRKFAGLEDDDTLYGLQEMIVSKTFQVAGGILGAFLEYSKDIVLQMCRIADRLNVFSWKSKSYSVMNDDDRLRELIISENRKFYLLLKDFYGPGGIYAETNSQEAETWRKRKRINSAMLPTRT